MAVTMTRLPSKKIAILFILLILFSASGAASSHIIAHWPMNDDSDSTVYDQSGNNNDGTLNGGAFYTTNSQEGSHAIDFPGDGGDYIYVPDDSSLHVNTLTAEAWINPDQHSQTRTIFEKNGEYKMAIYQGEFVGTIASDHSGCSNSEPGFWCDDDNYGDRGWVYGFDISSSEGWVHVAFSWNTTHYKFFKDGTLVRAVAPADLAGDSANIRTIGTDFRIGTKWDGTSTKSEFDGIIDDLYLHQQSASDDGSELHHNDPPNAPTNPNPSDGATVSTSDPSISAYYDDPNGDDGTLYYYNASDDSLINSCPVSDGNRCSVTWSGLSDGQHAWYAVAEDSNSATAQSSTWTFTVDASVSTQITGPSASDWYGDDFTVTVDDDADAQTCEWRIDDGNDGTWDEWWNSRSCPDGSFTVTVGGADTCSTEGTDACLVEVRVEDDNGNTGTDSATFNIDYTAPSSTLQDNTTWFGDDFTLYDEVTDSDALSGLQYCEYQTMDGSGGSWSGTKTRSSCQEVSATVAETSAECTTEGENECGIRIRAVDNAGNVGSFVEEYYNIDYSEITVTDDYTKTGWQNTSQDVIITCQDGDKDCGQIDWRIKNASTGNNLRPDTGYYSDGPTSSVTEDVGSVYSWNLTLEYRGWGTFGNKFTEWKQTYVPVDTVDPTTTIADDSAYHDDDFTASVTDTDGGGSQVDQNRCEYQTNDGSSGWAGWKTRNCQQASITVGEDPSNNECTTEGTDTCGVRTRVWDNAGNSDTDTEWFNIDYSGPQTDDNYTDDEWKESPQPIELTCTDDGSGCQSIEWWVTYQDGTMVKTPQNDSGSSTELTVGDQENGELYLHYRGWDNINHVEDPENVQRVRVETDGPETEILSPDNTSWYNDDLTITVNDTAGAAGLGELDLYYIADSSGSFEDEWETLTDNISYIEEEVEESTGTDVSSILWALNQSYASESRAVCVPGMTRDNLIPTGEDGVCFEYFSRIDDFSEVVPYLSWRNDTYGTNLQPGTYYPHNEDPTQEMQEAWGAGMLDVMKRDNWRESSYRTIINVGDTDSNGGEGDSASCGDDISWDLTYHLESVVEDENISTFSMLGDPEAYCNGNPTEAEQQMDTLGDVVRYDNAEELPDLIIDALDDFDAYRCQYRISENGGNTWTDWQQRKCPDGGFTVTVGEDSSNDCTQEGKDMCVVQTRVTSASGNSDTATHRYNIDLTAPDAECDDCATPDPVVVEKDVTFAPNTPDRPNPETDEHAGWESTTICQDSTCNNPYCSYTSSSADEYCTHTTDFPYGEKSFCIKTEDTIGNTETFCDSSWSFTVLAGIGDPCNANQQCLFGECRGGVCRADNIPPPRIVLH